MITATSAHAAADAPGTLGGSLTTASSRLDRDAFLRLLVTQLRHQDPMNPLQAHEFAAQLAQFTSVEQLEQLNQGVLEQIQASQFSALMDKTQFAAALVGRRVTVVGDRVEIPASGPASVRFEAADGGRATLRLLDDAGREVASRDLGTLAAGRQSVELPAGLPPGRWHYAIDVVGGDGAAISVTTFSAGIVDAVEFLNGGLVLKIGGLEAGLDDLVEIESATPATPVTTLPLEKPDLPGIGPVRLPIRPALTG